MSLKSNIQMRFLLLLLHLKSPNFCLMSSLQLEKHFEVLSYMIGIHIPFSDYVVKEIRDEANKNC